MSVVIVEMHMAHDNGQCDSKKKTNVDYCYWLFTLAGNNDWRWPLSMTIEVNHFWLQSTLIITDDHCCWPMTIVGQWQRFRLTIIFVQEYWALSLIIGIGHCCWSLLTINITHYCWLSMLTIRIGNPHLLKMIIFWSIMFTNIDCHQCHPQSLIINVGWKCLSMTMVDVGHCHWSLCCPSRLPLTLVIIWLSTLNILIGYHHCYGQWNQTDIICFVVSFAFSLYTVENKPSKQIIILCWILSIIIKGNRIKLSYIIIDLELSS